MTITTMLVALLATSVPLVAQKGAMSGMTTAAIAKMASPATVTILTLNTAGDTLGTGSGFIVRSNGVIVTNWHVMQGASLSANVE